MSDFATALDSDVQALLRQVAERTIMPHFRQLRDGDAKEKTPGEWVTIADHQAEEMLTERLTDLLPGSRVVGEEAAASDPGVLERLDEGLVWVVDPLDGTAHFAAGREPFGTMVALAADGVTLGGWIFLPVPGQMYRGLKGQGAFAIDPDGTSRRLQTTDPQGTPIAGLATQFMTPALREATLAAAEGVFELQPIPRCAAEHYPRLCRNENHIALFQRTLPWDHAAGALIFAEAGGYIARWNGAPYHFHDGELGILAANSRKLWDRAADVLFACGTLHEGGNEILPSG